MFAQERCSATTNMDFLSKLRLWAVQSGDTGGAQAGEAGAGVWEKQNLSPGEKAAGRAVSRALPRDSVI